MKTLYLHLANNIPSFLFSEKEDLGLENYFKVANFREVKAFNSLKCPDPFLSDHDYMKELKSLGRDYFCELDIWLLEYVQSEEGKFEYFLGGSDLWDEIHNRVLNGSRILAAFSLTSTSFYDYSYGAFKVVGGLPSSKLSRENLEKPYRQIGHLSPRKSSPFFLE